MLAFCAFDKETLLVGLSNARVLSTTFATGRGRVKKNRSRSKASGKGKAEVSNENQ